MRSSEPGLDVVVAIVASRGPGRYIGSFGNDVKRLLILLCLSLLSACGPPDIRLKRVLVANEVVGTWQLDPRSSALEVNGDNEGYNIDQSLSKPHEIVFRSDGTCRYRSVLQIPTRYVDASGEWKIVPTSDDPKGSEIEIRLNSDGGGVFIFSLDVKEESGRLILWQFWSDPDLWEFLEYKRKDTEQGGGGNSAALRGLP